MSQVASPTGPAAVAKMFEPIKAFQERLSKLLPAFDQLERLGKDAASAFELVSGLADHLDQFAQAYAPVKAFQGEVSALAQKFEPLKSIQNQLTEMSRSFRDNLNQLGTVMEPAGKVHERLTQLAKTFEAGIALKGRFQLLSREFETLSGPAPSAPSGAALNGAKPDVQEAVAKWVSNP